MYVIFIDFFGCAWIHSHLLAKMINKEVYQKKFSNSAEVTAGSYAYFDFQADAEKSDYLPHNKLRLFNKSSVEVWVWLNGVEDANQPDYILGAGIGVDESVLEGVQFSLIAIQNKDGAVSINANEFKGRFATVKEV